MSSIAVASYISVIFACIEPRTSNYLYNFTRQFHNLISFSDCKRILYYRDRNLTLIETKTIQVFLKIKCVLCYFKY